MKYRAAILERDPALQLLRIVEAYHLIQDRIEKVGQNSDERRKLDNAISTLDSLRSGRAKKSVDGLLAPRS